MKLRGLGQRSYFRFATGGNSRRGTREALYITAWRSCLAKASTVDSNDSWSAGRKSRCFILLRRRFNCALLHPLQKYHPHHYHHHHPHCQCHCQHCPATATAVTSTTASSTTRTSGVVVLERMENAIHLICLLRRVLAYVLALWLIIILRVQLSTKYEYGELKAT